MSQSSTVRVPDSSSPLEGVYLLTTLLRRQLETATRLRRRLGEAGREATEDLVDGSPELLWRLRSILDAADPGPFCPSTAPALLELSGLSAAGAALQSGDAAARLVDRLDEILRQTSSVARQCSGCFDGSPFADEFRLAGELALEQQSRLGALRANPPVRLN